MQIIKTLEQTIDHCLKDFKPVFRAVEIHARPVTDHDRRLLLFNDLDHAPGFQISSDELIGTAGFCAVPASEPVACATDD